MGRGHEEDPSKWEERSREEGSRECLRQQWISCLRRGRREKKEILVLNNRSMEAWHSLLPHAPRPTHLPTFSSKSLHLPPNSIWVSHHHLVLLEIQISVSLRVPLRNTHTRVPKADHRSTPSSSVSLKYSLLAPVSFQHLLWKQASGNPSFLLRKTCFVFIFLCVCFKDFIF